MPFPNQSPQSLNQSSQKTIRKQRILIRFYDFQLELSKNNWKSEGLNWKRKGNNLHTEGNYWNAEGNNWNAEGLIKNTTRLNWNPLIMTNY